jgi:prepilin-type N-terminal cleavage/methylation domain-containing protein
MSKELPNDEARRNGLILFRHSSFVINSSFVIRHSSFASFRLEEIEPIPVRHSSFVIDSSFVIRHSSFSSFVIRHSSFRRHAAFTIIELLIVMTIILVLAGLILATAGYVQKKGARSRTEAEIAAMSAALESYKADNGVYPPANSLDARQNGNPATYSTSSLSLYNALFGTTNGNRTAAPGTKTYLTFKPNMLVPRDQNVAVSAIVDPFGNSYGYSTIANRDANPGTPGTTGYNPTFDLWSTGGETSGSESPKWIKNW